MVTVRISAAAIRAFLVFIVSRAGPTACTGENIKQHQALHHKTYN